MFHGEYKVPGGKLVVVDFEVEAGKITRFKLSGDFFLEPDEVLPIINQSLESVAITSDSAELEQIITRAVPKDTVFFGFSPEAIAVAIRRALNQATDWLDYQWEIIHEAAIPPLLHLSLDQVLTEQVGSGNRNPTLRIWEWEEPAVVIGSFQSLKNEVDLENAKKYGVQVVRRISGGGAMFMEAGSVVTYSLYLPEDLIRGMSFAQSYEYLDSWVLQALKSLGIEASYKPLNDITSDKGKIGGAAQKRLGNGGVLHHVTMSYDLDADKMVQILRIGREKISDKGISSAQKRVDPLKSQTNLQRSEIIDRLKSVFTELYRAVPGRVTEAELAAAEKLVAEKFASKEWIERVP